MKWQVEVAVESLVIPNSYQRFHLHPADSRYFEILRAGLELYDTCGGMF